MGIFIDTLPVHPPPYPLESLSSYIIRLSEANGIRSYYEIWRLMMRQLPGSKCISQVVDLPPMEEQWIAAVSAQSEEVILGMTFTPLAANLGRLTHPHSISRYLAGEVSDNFRYCPICIAETPYYRLTWRFTNNRTCPIHSCFLVDKCPHCQNDIPIMQRSLRIGICPSCFENISLCEPQYAPSSVIREDAIFQSELEFLLTFQSDILRDGLQGARIGERLRMIRNFYGYLYSRLNVQTGIYPSIIKKLESGTVRDQGGNFSQLRTLVSIYKINLIQLVTGDDLNKFRHPVPSKLTPKVTGLNEEHSIRGGKRHRTMARLENKAEIIRQTFERMHLSGEIVTRARLTAAVGLRAIHEHEDPELKDLFTMVQKAKKHALAQKKKIEEQKLIQAVSDFISKLQPGLDPDEALLEIMRHIGKTREQIKRYPELVCFLSPYLGRRNGKAYQSIVQTDNIMV